MDASLGPARPDDLPAIVSLLERSGLATQGIAECLRTALVARVDGRVAGTAGLEIYGASALLRSVAVEEPLRSQGLGARLTRAALELARQSGVRRVYLLAEEAAAYYPRFGFQPVPRDRVDPAVRRSGEFVSACPESARAMVMDLAIRDDSAAGAARERKEA